jgi:hypothetical protein
MLDTMKYKYIIAAIVVCSLLLPILFYSFYIIGDREKKFEEFYVGVDAAYAGLEEITSLVDKVSLYTNMFVIGSTGISYEADKLDQVCQYLYDHNLKFAVFAAGARRLPQINQSVAIYGNDFLGIYYDDEMGGQQLDLAGHQIVIKAENYSDAAAQFINYVSNVRLNSSSYINNTDPLIPPSNFRLFTSDYALYWFTYKAGYDVVLAQLGWNYSRQLNVALCRGAATVMDKDWGVIVTWTYTDPPYLGSAEELFDDLVLAYDNGAKYILVFDSNEEYTQSTLSQEHLDALESFWQYTKDNIRPADLLDGRVAFVLPKDYAYGFRGPADKIWGLWEGDEFSLELSQTLGALLKQYGSRLDVVYDDGLELDNTYETFYFWNGTSYVP